ncbi:MAG: TMEM165/GDT1 family protein [Planctomycetes bacterium]|nr:TMEM165/GDT1 family protein [Planctomycetota bacterium]
MDWKLFSLTFTSVFLAEFGDKTQLATLAFAGQSRKPWLIFLASSLALVLAAGIGAAVGGVAARWISPVWMRRGAAVLFVVIGLWILVSEWRAASQ